MSLFEARDLTAVLRGDTGDVRVLDGVALSVAEGELVDVVGPSGSGKSTLLRALAQLLPGASGTLSVAGTAATDVTPQRWRSLVTLLPQKPVTFDGCVRDNLLVPWSLGVRKAHRPPGDAQLAEGLERLGVDVALDRDASRLSVGQVARLAFLRTLLTEPTVLLLDEPDAALDDVSADAVTAMIAEFLAGGATGPSTAAPAPAATGAAPARAVIRVRHHRSDGAATRRLCLQGGRLSPEEVGS